MKKLFALVLTAALLAALFTVGVSADYSELVDVLMSSEGVQVSNRAQSPDLQALEEAIPALEGNLAGFSHPEAVLTAPETRSSSPVRILRDDTRQSTLRGLYPCGEGAGYAGGIMSAAVDGILTAEAALEI